TTTTTTTTLSPCDACTFNDTIGVFFDVDFGGLAGGGFYNVNGDPIYFSFRYPVN
ncbi:unnamed protein product, partial [Rotaria sp. Silwood1]